MSGSRRELDFIRPKLVAAPVDRRIAALAADQHGVVATSQLVALGLTARAVSHRVAAGRLHRVHRGVYAVGHPVLAPRARWMAGVLACGPGAALSHASAADLWEIRRTDAARTDVIVPTAGGRAKRARLRVHRAPDLGPGEVTTRHGIPVTTAARTILDLAAVLHKEQLERLLDQAEIEQVTDYRLVVEADSWKYHRTRHRFERDRRRDAVHTLAGYRTLRFTDRQLEHQPESVAAIIKTVLAA